MKQFEYEITQHPADAFKQVAREVYRESRKAQYPWLEGLILGRFYFRPPGSSDVAPDLPPPPPLPVTVKDWLEVICARAKDSPEEL